MPDAFSVSFVCALVAPSPAAAHERVQQLRQLSVGLGFDPGPGMVKSLAPGELAKMPELATELEDARVRAHLSFGPAATEGEQLAASQAILDVASGDAELAELVYRAIETAHGGYLPRSVARELARGQREGARA
jgi:hypothetical protein